MPNHHRAQGQALTFPLPRRRTPQPPSRSCYARTRADVLDCVAERKARTLALAGACRASPTHRHHLVTMPTPRRCVCGVHRTLWGHFSEHLESTYTHTPTLVTHTYTCRRPTLDRPWPHRIRTENEMWDPLEDRGRHRRAGPSQQKEGESERGSRSGAWLNQRSSRASQASPTLSRTRAC